MKNSFKGLIVLLVSFSILSSSLAEASCSEKFRNQIDEHRLPRVLLGGAGGFGAGWVASGVLGGGIACALMPVGAIIGLAPVLILGMKSERTALRLFDEAEAGHGKKIRKLYAQYLDHAKDPVSFAEFCQIIHEGDVNESLCKNDVKLRKGDLIFYVSDRE